MMTTWEIYNQDVMDWLASYNGPKFHALLTDPPYNLKLLGKSWDDDIALRPETWEAIAKVMLPGALTFTFMHSKYAGLLHLAQAQADFTHGNSFYNYSAGAPDSLPYELGYIDASSKPNYTKSDKEGHVYACAKSQNQPIIVAQAPMTHKTQIANVREFGTGCINMAAGKEFMTSGRTVGPGQLLLTHHPDCEPRKRKIKSGASWSKHKRKESLFYDGIANEYEGSLAKNGYETAITYTCHQDCIIPKFAQSHALDPDKVNLYFAQFHWLYEQMERIVGAVPLIYYPKPGLNERNFGLGDFDKIERTRLNPGGLSSISQKFAPTYQENAHPTLKPVHLAYYLASLLKPHEDYGPLHLLNLFCGSGTEGAGGIFGGWDDIAMVDSGQRHCEVAEARMTAFRDGKEKFGKEINTIINQGFKQPEQLSLF